METAKFSELGLSSKVYEAVAAAGYTEPTPIQSQAIPVAVTGRDVLGIAQTGTGKTAAFVLPMITQLEKGRARARMPRTLILAPTRELAAQVAEAFEKYGVNHKLSLALLIGGVSFEEQNRKLDRGVDVLIATPGRLLDHTKRGKLLLTGVEILVIDEADRMLDMGFIPDIERICKVLPPRRQTLFFSATMPPEIQRLVDQFLKDPVRIEVARPATAAQTITQRFQYCPDGEDWTKREMLRDMIRSEDVQNAIIFCNRKRDVAILHKSLVKHGFNAGALHGDMDQSSRTATLDKFRSGEITILAASDVAARGLDIPEVSHVFNFDVPWVGDDYVHRIGRTGRAGREGFSATLVGPDDLKLLQGIEKATGVEPEWIGEPPTDEDYEQSGKKRRGRGGRSRSSEPSAPRARNKTKRGAGSGKSRPGRERKAEGEETATDTDVIELVQDDADEDAKPTRTRRRGGRGRRGAEGAADKNTNGDQPVSEAQDRRPQDEDKSAAPSEPKRNRRSGGRQRGQNAQNAERRERNDSRERGDNANSFHDGNLPAFLQRPVRAPKASDSKNSPEKPKREAPADVEG